MTKQDLAEHLLNGGKLVLTLDGERIELDREDFIIEPIVPPGFAAVFEGKAYRERWENGDCEE